MRDCTSAYHVTLVISPSYLTVICDMCLGTFLAQLLLHVGLHIALQLGHIACARVLLEESDVNLLAINSKYAHVTICMILV